MNKNNVQMQWDIIRICTHSIKLKLSIYSWRYGHFKMLLNSVFKTEFSSTGEKPQAKRIQTLLSGWCYIFISTIPINAYSLIFSFYPSWITSMQWCRANCGKAPMLHSQSHPISSTISIIHVMEVTKKLLGTLSLNAVASISWLKWVSDWYLNLHLIWS